MNDFKVYRMLKISIKLVNDHYELPLPWKYEDQVMPNNKNLALKRLNHLKRFPLFVSRRLKFITKSTCTSNWRHVPSELNPADVLSRGCRSDKLMKTKSWLSGPEFLSESPDSWPCRFAETTLDVENVKAFDKKAASAFLITEMIEAVDKPIAYFLFMV